MSRLIQRYKSLRTVRFTSALGAIFIVAFTVSCCFWIVVVGLSAGRDYISVSTVTQQAESPDGMLTATVFQDKAHLTGEMLGSGVDVITKESPERFLVFSYDGPAKDLSIAWTDAKTLSILISGCKSIISSVPDLVGITFHYHRTVSCD